MRERIVGAVMKRIGALAGEAMSGDVSGVGGARDVGDVGSPRGLPERTIERVFMKLGAIFLNAWSSNFPTADAVKVGMGVWASGLSELSIDQIGRGLKACESKIGFPPSLGEFKRLCVGLPSRPVCVARVVAGEGVDLLSWSVMRRIGAYDLKHSAVADLERRAGVLYEGLYVGAYKKLCGATSEWMPPESEVVVPAGEDVGVVGRQGVLSVEESEALARASLRALRAGRGR